MYEEFNRERIPSHLSVDDPYFFKQTTTGGGTHFIYDEDAGITNFEFTDELEDLKKTTTWIGNKTIIASRKYTKTVPVSIEASKANKVGKIEQIGKEIGRSARRTMESEAILRTYGDVTVGTFYTTPDAVALGSNSHVTLRGATVDNLETGTLTPDNLWTGNNSLANQVGQSGEREGHLLSGMVVPHVRYKDLVEIMHSPLAAYSAENNLNIWASEYGDIMLRQSSYLNSGTGGNTATNANTTYTLISENHKIMRAVFYGLESYTKGLEETENLSFEYVYHYSEVEFPGTWTGTVISSGTVA